MKFFRVATEGNTIDGRRITAEHIAQMAKNYDPDKYAARVWIEHNRSIMPDGPFKAYGDITALKTEKNTDGKLVLLAAIEATADLKAINKKGQKLYSSVEIQPNFAETGEAYLVGLAVTDSPASLGTERLMFSAIEAHKAHLFSAYQDAELNFSDDADKPGIFARVKEMLSKHQSEQTQKSDSQFNAFCDDVTKAIDLVIHEYNTRDEQRDAQYDQLQEKYSALRKEFDALKNELDGTPAGDRDDYTHRPTADGTTVDDQYETDC